MRIGLVDAQADPAVGVEVAGSGNQLTALLAGKLHAILQRPYTKGRDVYDLLWYLSDPEWPAPNLTLLNNALQQTGWEAEPLTGDNWRRTVRHRFQAVDWEQIVADVLPFLDPITDPGILTLENLMRVLELDSGGKR